jgi:hypothetical protein
MEKSEINVGNPEEWELVGPSLNILAGISEFAAKPEAVIVHDPVECGGLHALMEAPLEVDLEEELLFRSSPNYYDYARQYQAFVLALRCNVPQVIYFGTSSATIRRMKPSLGIPTRYLRVTR